MTKMKNGIRKPSCNVIFTNLLRRDESVWRRVEFYITTDDSESKCTCHSNLQCIFYQAVGCLAIRTSRNRYAVVLEVTDNGWSIKCANYWKRAQGRKQMLL